VRNDYVVLDTNILVSALWSRDGNPAMIMQMVTSGKVLVCYNWEIITEYKDVLFRDRFKHRFSHDEINRLLEYVSRFGENILDVQKSNIQLPDESDRIFYDVAKASNAILITGNRKHYPDNEPFIMSAIGYLQQAKRTS